ncbi:MAG: type II secretion system protein [bacterium]|nr:type II secretion system protein [bacterium]
MIETLVVMGVFIVAGAVAVPTLTRVRQDSQADICAKNLASVNYALGMLQSDFPGWYAPKYDDAFATHGSGHFNRLATWLDVLCQLSYINPNMYIDGNSPAYCPADQMPDPINEQRGTAWQYRYPYALGGGYGVDHSYAISMPYSSAANPTDFPCWDPDGHPDGRVIAADGWWTWTHNFGGVALVSGRWDDPLWGSNTIGYRHKFAANLLHRDGHVVLVAYDIDPTDYAPVCNESGVDTTQHFMTRPGEPLQVHPYVPSHWNDCDNPPPGCVEYPMGSGALPDQLNPEWYTANNAWTVPGIYQHKGWIAP